MSRLRPGPWLRPLCAACLLSVAGCAAATDEGHMERHDERAGVIQAAIVRGDVDGVRQPARWLASHQHLADLPPASVVVLESFRSEARALAGATDLESAAEGAGRLYRSCGACHELLGAPQEEDTGPAPEGDDLATHMRRHAWAADRLRVGLTGPSEAAWGEGVVALAEQPLDAWTLEAPLDQAERARELGERVHELARQVAGAMDWDDRAAAFGRFLGACARCHSGTP